MSNNRQISIENKLRKEFELLLNKNGTLAYFFETSNTNYIKFLENKCTQLQKESGKFKETFETLKRCNMCSIAGDELIDEVLNTKIPTNHNKKNCECGLGDCLDCGNDW